MAGKVKFFLLFLSEASHKQVQLLLQLSSKSQILGLREVAANLLQGNILVDNHQKAKLKRSRVFYRELAAKGVTRKLVENSRTIAFLLAIARPVLLQL